MRLKRSVLLIMLLLEITLHAQNNTNSPYSGFGIGELQLSSGGQNAAMGQTGIALRSDLFLNTTNPAAFTAIEPKGFLLDVGLNFKYTQLKNTSKSVDVNKGNISWIQMGFPISKRFFGGFSINPKSSVGYKIYSLKTLDGTSELYPVTYEGTGGLSEVDAILAFKVNRNFSMGAKAGYLWGTVNRTSAQDITVSSVSYTLNQEDKKQYSGLYLNLGTQLIVPLSEKRSLTLGGIMGVSSKLNSEISSTVTKTYNTSSEVMYSDIKTSGTSKLPMDMGVGAAFTFGPKLTASFDYKYCNWEKAQLQINSHNLVTNNSYRAGLEFTPKDSRVIYRQAVKYRLGVRYDSGYLKLYNNDIQEHALSVGVGLPMRKSRSYSNFSVELGQSGTLKSSLVQERYIRLNCSFNLWENMFVKRQYD